jgi:hypothetical protein
MENVAACDEAAAGMTSVEVDGGSAPERAGQEPGPLPPHRRPAFLRPGVLSRRSRRRAR